MGVQLGMVNIMATTTKKNIFNDKNETCMMNSYIIMQIGACDYINDDYHTINRVDIKMNILTIVMISLILFIE